MKGYRALVILIIVIVASMLLCAADFSDDFEYKVILPDTPIYTSADVSSPIIGYIPQKAIVTPIGDPETISGVTWQKISYTSLTGYVQSTALYKSYTNDDYTVTIAKVKSNSMGQDVALYSTHSETVGVDKYVHDGEKISVIDDGIDYGAFVLIEYDGERYFIYSDNVTTGLSYNQL